MEVIHIPSGPVCQNHSTTVPRRLEWKIKHAIQVTIFNWNFNYNLFNTNREGNERTESATGEFLLCRSVHTFRRLRAMSLVAMHTGKTGP